MSVEALLDWLREGDTLMPPGWAAATIIAFLVFLAFQVLVVQRPDASLTVAGSCGSARRS